MKTLKKTLCLVLAMVMLFGLCAVSASAKLVYSDNNDITYKEAVDVMTGIGILAGDSRGFRPTDKITRAEAAKIIAYIMIGDSAQADALKATSDPFPDVPVSHWASGYISYCATSGIIAGKGDGYHPNEYVKGLEFAKMLLRALGYGQQSEYIGADWSINTSKDALRYGIFNGNLAGASTEDATREECALYAFNTIAGANENADGIKTGIKKVSYSTLLGNYIENAMGAVNPDANKGKTFGDDFGLKYQIADDDVFGRITGHHWSQRIGNNTKIISGDYDDDQRLIAVYTDEVTSGDMYKLLVDRFGKSFLDDVQTEHGSGYVNQGEFELYINSEFEANDTFDTTTSVYAVDPDEFKKGDSAPLAHTGKGVQTYVYAWTELLDESTNTTVDHVRICIVDTYLAKVDKVVAAKGDKDPVTTVSLVKSNNIYDNKGTNLTSGNQIGNANKYDIPTDEFEKGDYVLVTITAKDDSHYNLDTATNYLGTVVDYELAPTMTTEVTRFTKKANAVSIVAKGETYVPAKNSAGDSTAGSISTEGIDNAAEISNEIVDGKDHVIYLDNFGYLLATSPVAAASNYAFVAKFGMKTNDATTLNDEAALRAAVYFADGTNGVYTVDHKEGIFEDEEIDWAYTFETNGVAYKADEVYIDGNQSEPYAVVGVYKVSVDKNTVTLLANNKDDDVVTTPNSETYVTKGQANIFYANQSRHHVANTSTVFFYAHGKYDDKDFKVTVYNGINEVPTVKIADRATSQLVNYIESITSSAPDGIMKAAYVSDSIESGETNDIVYYFGGTQVETLERVNYIKTETVSGKEWTVDYKVYGGDDAEYVTITYTDTKKADQDIKTNFLKPGFVKVVNGKLTYVAKEDGTTNKAGEDNKILYAVEGEIALVSGDNADTLGVKYKDKTPTVVGTGTANDTWSNTPLYEVAANGHLYDLRDKTDRAATDGEINSIDALIDALNDAGNGVGAFKIAISVKDANDTNVVTGIYLLANKAAADLT